MELNYSNLEKEVINTLENNKIWVLSTSENDIVTSRSMSVINIGLNIYFQTSTSYIKSKQMNNNNNVALCYNNISIEGIAEEIGDWDDENNFDILELYKKYHQSSYKLYGNLKAQVVYRVVPKVIRIWKYIDGEPIREFLYVDEKRAERLEFGGMDKLYREKV